MAEQLKDLIEKIEREGVLAGEELARQIKKDAEGKAESILQKAKAEAERIIASAKDEAERTRQSTEALLQQAARDMLLSLRKEIDTMLERLIISEAGQSLSGDGLLKIISEVIHCAGGKEGDEVVISTKKEDAERLQRGLLEKLKESVKKGIVVKPSEDITGGFIISFDGGKSHFNFTDKALAEYIGSYLKPALAEILNKV